MSSATIIFDELPNLEGFPSAGEDTSMHSDDFSLGSMGADFDLQQEKEVTDIMVLSPTQSPPENASDIRRTALAPRLVSSQSMTNATNSSKQPNNERPSPNASFESVQGTQPLQSKKRSASVSSGEGTEIASIVDVRHGAKKSSMIAQFLEQQKQQQQQQVELNPHPTKKLKVESPKQNVFSFRSSPFKKVVYKLPLNVEIHKRASTEILLNHVVTQPDALSQPDGAGEYPLHILLKHKPDDSETVDAMLSVRPAVASLVDGYGNTPLHTAISFATCSGQSLVNVRHVCSLYPQALKERNFHGVTPLQLAQRRSSCPEAIANFLWEREQSLY